jgi:hypothetical protein
MLRDFLSRKFRHSELWAHPWLAGSGVSYQWSAEREPADLDCLIGIDFIQFRKANPEYRGLTDKEISDQLNENFYNGLQPETENWNGFELTFYALTSNDIRTIKPYAAYDLKYDEWTVTPNPAQVAPKIPEWDSVALNDYSMAHQVYTRTTKALQDLEVSHGGPQRRNAEVALHHSFQQADSIYETLHAGRSEAFAPTGEGYADFHNYRWQAGKKSGAISILKEIRQKARQHSSDETLYGVDLPDAATLIRRAALHRTN